ncbi:molybdopterin-dependent oxidoreductase [Rhodoplanes sp. TEM]|uniref:Molybdopterin-dependent oxidoreductase n=1 Tax=Rhodoplanes tepidamans TaxID=200616 RepID=A0ABT5JH26_RHOTP|nr:MULTISPECIES: molybdopterin-dependent oxidoreductase [Rhodoplanes]MDC7788798.1 molybdopterin-dependent oxidoreductase [Rhodoplanes tepidamans]MDC7984130.1 molybdopterin-dependent oxidoreductase [Rhodoplanes sp. TEM]MDQ0356890.1 anaerobic selenocysteine-containing dehydrogenase [Rhodoplanes tepidamans]
MLSRHGRDLRVDAKIPGEDTGIAIRKTLCSICEYKCLVDAYVKDGRLIKVEGSPGNPVNDGTLCSKGAASRQWVYNPDRLQTPLLRIGERGEGRWAPISWDEALDRIAARLGALKIESGPESVVFFAGYPKVMRPFLKRLAHTFGSPNYCTESSTCFAGTTIAGLLTYGYGLGQQGGAEIDQTRCILNWSTNLFYSQAPLGNRILDALDRGAKLIDVGPLRSLPAERADIHLRLRPGTCGALAMGMAHVIIEEGLHDRAFVEAWTQGFEQYRDYARQFTPDVTERITGVPRETIVAAARLYATTKPAALVTSACTTIHHTNGVQNHRAVTALIGLTGNFDRPGGNHIVPSSYYRPTGLAHREHAFEQTRPWAEMAPRVGQDRFPVWCRTVPQGQAMALPEQILGGAPYPIRAIVGFGLNHRMWPAPDHMREALRALDFFVDVELFMTESAKLADIVLPACSTFERNEFSISPNRYAIWTEQAIAPVGQSRPDVDIIIDLAKRLTPEDELMAQGHAACLEWIFAPAGLSIAELENHPGGMFLAGRPETPYEKYRKTGFPTPSKKMEFTSTVLAEHGLDALPVYREPMQSPVSTPELARDFPLILTTGSRLPMYIHGRTFRVPWLRRLHPDPTLDINPADADARGIAHLQWVEIATPRRALQVRANVTEYVAPGVVNMIHGYPGADANELIDPDYLDPVSGHPGYRSLMCEVRPRPAANGGSR